MRYIDIQGGLRTHITEEEDQLYSRVKQEKVIEKSTLSERERVIAKQLVSRGIFERNKVDNGWSYSVNSIECMERN